jgi:hypothetical protein
MAFPKTSGYPKRTRNKLVSKKISILTGENKKLPKHEKRTHKQIVAIALDMYRKQRRLPLA